MTEESLAVIFSSNLKNRRKELGLTQKKLGELIGYSEKSVSKWEIGVCIAPSAVLPILASALHTSIDALLTAPSRPEYFLGIDGGTKTEFLLVDKNGNPVAKTLLGASNPVDIGIGATLEILDEGISTVCSGIPTSSISVYAGISGGMTGEYQGQISLFLKNYHFASYANGSDAENALSATLGARDGILITAGVGTLAYVQKAGSTIRLGGFGYLFENGGNEFTIGQSAIRTALLKENGSIREDTLLYDAVRCKCSSELVLDSLAKFYSGGKKEISSYAPLVFEAAQKGDRIAREIIAENARCIAESIEDAGRHLRQEKISVVIAGSLTAYADQLLPLISASLKNKQRYRISAYTGSSVQGALILAGLNQENSK